MHTALAFGKVCGLPKSRCSSSSSSYDCASHHLHMSSSNSSSSCHHCASIHVCSSIQMNSSMSHHLRGSFTDEQKHVSPLHV